MKLYYAPGACSQADHIALIAAGIPFEAVKVDLKGKRTETGQSFTEINPKGYVPALQFDDGQVLTENIAILTWIADAGAPPKTDEAKADRIARFRRLEMLAFISTELHKNFKPFFSPDADDAAKHAAAKTLSQRLGQIADKMEGDFLFGAEPGVADDYLFVMLSWAAKNKVDIPAKLKAFLDRMSSRPEVRKALADEGLTQKAA